MTTTIDSVRTLKLLQVIMDAVTDTLILRYFFIVVLHIVYFHYCYCGLVRSNHRLLTVLCIISGHTYANILALIY